jgi:hypothetical protein
MVAASLCRTAWGELAWVFMSPVFPWSDGPTGAGRISAVVSPEAWFVTSHWSLLPIMQVTIEVCGCSLPDCPRWSDMLLFLPGSSWLQLWLVSSFPNKVGQLSVVPCPQYHEISSVICHALALECWLLVPPLLSVFRFSSCHLSQSLVPHLPLLSVFDSSFCPIPVDSNELCSLSMVFSFVHLLGLQGHTSRDGCRPVERNGEWLFSRQMFVGAVPVPVLLQVQASGIYVNCP